ncbi:zinc ABC transporter substrate-binding protein ZnuA [Hoeflea sp. YIM 152468]|uniref:zinc ABC transporter substrate-binding protein ZnuA n=1 Tax=Hoeflea sp. YIM 152468 TaxID=3031759 RepID=UPI0023DBF93D|nr:zinc ABC transporter substrate-binding protein ZnuA [Hoeflea sp. YIM 152468]MDF1608511.1 zinc ABC transporter substrate-binding protein ZnuA [Hoeflea sp. YIM 152468]
MQMFQRILTGTAAALVLLPALASQSLAEPRVVASIKPVHSLVAAVMEGVGTPDLIVGGAASPHSYALKPSQAGALETADLVFWIGHELETFLEKPIETIGAKARVVELIDAAGLVKLPFRTGGAFEAHSHDAHQGEEDHADHDTHEDHADHDTHDDHAGTGHDTADDHDHHGEFDAHVWLDPENAKVFTRTIANVLSETDPSNAAAYATNAARLEAQLDRLIRETAATLAPVRGKGFIVFHDAYQYFESRFGIAAAGSVTVNPDVRPGAERIAAIQDTIKSLGATCVFAEPQFESRLVEVASEGTNARTATLDPLGATLDDGPTLYFELISGMAGSMRDCLA